MRIKWLAKINKTRSQFSERSCVCNQKEICSPPSETERGQTVKPCLLQFHTSEQMAHLTGTTKRRGRKTRGWKTRLLTVRNCGNLLVIHAAFQNTCACTFHTVWLKSVFFSFLHDICSQAGIIKALLCQQKEGYQYWPRTSTSVSFCCRARAYDPTAYTRRLEGKSCNFQCRLSVIIRCWPFLLSQYRQANGKIICAGKGDVQTELQRQRAAIMWRRTPLIASLVPETQNILLKFWFHNSFDRSKQKRQERFFFLFRLET